MPDHSFEISFFESILARQSKYPEVLEILGSLYTETGRIDDGLQMDRRLVRLQPNNALAHYNLACSLSLKLKTKAALQALQKSIELGYRDAKWMREDEDLDALRGLPEFEHLINRLSAL